MKHAKKQRQSRKTETLSNSQGEGRPMATTITETSRSVSNILRTVPDEYGFHFYASIGSPTELKARSLPEFLAQVEKADPSSIKFHSERHDFESWVRMLGDPTLAKQLATLSGQELSAEELKAKMLRILRMRVGKLKKLSHVA